MTFCLLFSFVVNITRDIEIKNIVTIARGEWEGTVGRGVCRRYYKGTRGRVEVGGEVGLAGVGWRDGEKMQTIVTE